MAAQCPASTSLSSSHSSGPGTIAFHCCAQRATVRSVRFLPRPPMVTGGGGRRPGVGSPPASGGLWEPPAQGGVGWGSRRAGGGRGGGEGGDRGGAGPFKKKKDKR